MPSPIGERERVLERQRLIMEQRIKGLSLDALHTWWNSTYPSEQCARSTIAKDIQQSIDRSTKEITLGATQWRQVHIDRAEKLLSNKEFVKKLEDGDLFAYDRFIKLQDQIIRLTGSYAPTKITQTDLTGEKNATAGLTDDERLRLIQELLESARERKALAEPHIQIIDAEIVENVKTNER